jgi:hypothetical protein
VNLERLDDKGVVTRFFGVNGRMIRADPDDRGVYRFYGLPPGKYLVSVGERSGDGLSSGAGTRAYTRVYHPSASNSAEATPVDVGVDDQDTGIDIKLSGQLKSFAVSGYVIDAEARKPIVRVRSVQR